ncbi:MAG TPA: GDP-mannose 4,6-dehydratase [Gaiellaceae bacterium]|nr:GDP-mannose 4,6-dehydratase [Gaiellaceae bacterium]
MSQTVQPRTALVTGATGQDGYFLVRKLLSEGWSVHVAVRDVAAAEEIFEHHPGLRAVRRDLRDPGPLCALVGDLRPEEMYNLAGESSVGASFADPKATWESNADIVARLLEAVRLDSPGTHFYQASSGEMFGSTPGGSIVHDENSVLSPQSPYAAAKAAAHLLCQSYRESYNLRIACGILFNHESHRRGPQFLSRKVVDHVISLRNNGDRQPLMLGNLEAQRDWGFAPNYVDGMISIIRQAAVRGLPDEASSYNDYVLGTGHIHHVWELVDRAFTLAGFPLVWDLTGPDPVDCTASFADSGAPAVAVDPTFLRPADPKAIGANPAKVTAELGWEPVVGLDVFLEDMLAAS